MLEFVNSNLYSVVAGITLAVHLIINWRELAGRGNAGSRTRGEIEVRRFLVSLTVFFLADVLWGVFSGLKWIPVLYADTVLFFLTMALSVLTWSRYVVAYLEMVGASRWCALWMGRGLMAFFAVSLVVNFFAGGFFTISPDCVYREGPVRQLALLLLVAFNAIGVALTLVALRRKEGAMRRRCRMVFAFGVTMTAAIVLQLADPFLPLYGLGCLFGCCILHVFVIEDERDEMHRNELRARDIGAQLQAERSANRAKSLFFSSVSHDIRTPLNAIVGFSDLLGQGGADEAERARCISLIRSSAKVLARLVDDILDLSKLESGKLEIVEEPTDLPALVREVVAACDIARTRKSLVLQTRIDAMPWVCVDPHRLRQILFNLLSNAFKYTDRGTVSVRALWRDGLLEVAVSDTGKGISKENQDLIFQPFVQLPDRKHREGTGLGLPICRRLAELMGGELTVLSEDGGGSTFALTLHGVKTAEPPAAGPVPPGGPARLERVPSRVLVVDDSPVNRAVLKAMLAKCGVGEVATAENGREALDALAAGPAFGLVLTDLWMPGMDGRELLRAIRADATLAGLPVYLVTADVEVREPAGADGFDGILIKPVSLEKIRALFGGAPGR